MNNKWTVCLAALGLVSVASVAQAEEKASQQVLTSLSSTTLSGYVDTSAHWNFGTGNANLPVYKFNSPNKADGFNLNVVQVSLDKPLDESEWASGYHVDMWAGPDAGLLDTGTSGDVAVRQAYVALRAPLGTGLNLKMGVFDSIVGYENLEAGKNPNYTRSYGNTLDPQTHTGLLATYRFCEVFSASAGVANTAGPAINERAHELDTTRAESYKTYMGSVALTAPEGMGFLKGSSLYAGVVSGFNNTHAANSSLPTANAIPAQTYYIGSTITTPIEGLRFGAAYDLLVANSYDTLADLQHKSDDSALAGYVSYQATEKLSLHGRFDWLRVDNDTVGSVNDQNTYATTATVQYDLWANVLSRLEFRWDHAEHGNVTYGNADRANAFLLALNVIYKF